MRILLTGGGTGGHLYPALSLAQALSAAPADPGVCAPDDGEPKLALPSGEHELLFVGTRGGMEAAIAQRANLKVVAVRSRPLSRSSLAAAAGGLAANVVGTGEAMPVVAKFHPDVVIATGGYASVPVVMAAAALRASGALRRTKIVLLEPNVEPGRANRFMAAAADEVWGAFEDTAGFFGRKFVLTGMPVRPEIYSRPTQVEARRSLGLDLKLSTVLVFGGSQGARFFSEALPPALLRLPDEMRGRLTVVQQAREEDLAALRGAYAKAKVAVHLASFFSDLPERIAATQLVIARAGASTVAELTAIGRPCLLVPLPHALDNDQLENATRLQEVGGGWCVRQSELTTERLAVLLQDLFSSPARLADAAKKAHALATVDAAKRLADFLDELVKSKE